MPHSTPEKRKAYADRYYAANKKRFRENAIKWQNANKDKVKSSKLKNAYGITLAERDALLESQGHACAACGSPSPHGKTGWHVDHCHETGKVRGILCHFCNVAAGNAGDNPTKLRQIADYLERHLREAGHGHGDRSRY